MPPALLRLVRLLALGLLPLLAAAPLSAQTPRAPAAPPVQLRFMSWERAATGLFLRSGERAYAPVSAPAYGWGTAHEVPASSTLRLYHLVQREGRQVHEVAAEAPLPADCADFQIALLRRGGERPYQMIVLPSDPRLFQVREVRLFNFTPHPAMVRLGSENISLAPLEWRKVATTPDHKYRLTLLSALQVAEVWVPSSQQILTLRPGYRGEVTLVHSASPVDDPRAAPGGASRAITLVDTSPLPRARGGAGL